MIHFVPLKNIFIHLRLTIMSDIIESVNYEHTQIGIDIGLRRQRLLFSAMTEINTYSRYERHQAAVYPLIYTFRRGIRLTGDTPSNFHHRKRGMGVAERCGLPFVQEGVVAATKFVTGTIPFHTLDNRYRRSKDAKVVFLFSTKIARRLAHERES